MVQDTAYTVSGLWKLLDRAGLQFLAPHPALPAASLTFTTSPHTARLEPGLRARLASRSTMETMGIIELLDGSVNRYDFYARSTIS